MLNNIVKKINGFTIIEIIIAITILGIVLVLAVPSLTQVLQANQATQQSHDFVSAIQLSITEAEKSNTNVTLCAKKELLDECVNYTTSPGTDTWQHGWLLFTDTANNGVFDSGSDELIKTQINGKNSIKAVAPASAVTITPGGQVIRGSGDYNFSPTTCTLTNGHKITIYTSGQLVVKGGVCP